MATQTQSPGTMSNDASIGTVAWTNPDNAKISDNLYATMNASAGDGVGDNQIKIVKSNGTIGTTNKADVVTNWSKTEGIFPYGSSSDLWGETWIPADINNTNFGVVLSVDGEFTSNYLKATNFGFSIPTSATINGILVNIERVNTGALNGGIANVDHISITVSYTEATSSLITGVQSMTSVQSITF